jgi:DNA (cytosine-5)-methyltransferase 1
VAVKPVLLDLYCGAGGGAEGYARAGFDVVGVDIEPQPHFPGTFIQAEALSFLAFLAEYPRLGRQFAAVHASPPCQAYSMMSQCRPGLAERYPRLIAPTRMIMRRLGLPYIIENVPGSDLRQWVQLCGTQFALATTFNGRKYELQRHRWFEASWPLRPPAPCVHGHRSFPVYGRGQPGNRRDLAGPGFAKASREVMGIGWMNREEMNEALPPAYTEYVGRQLRDVLRYGEPG